MMGVVVCRVWKTVTLECGCQFLHGKDLTGQDAVEERRCPMHPGPNDWLQSRVRCEKCKLGFPTKKEFKAHRDAVHRIGDED